jgi:hypothetical protein
VTNFAFANSKKEIVETNACISEVQSEVSRLPASDPARIRAGALMGKLLEGRAVAFRTLLALVEGVELRQVQH